MPKNASNTPTLELGDKAAAAVAQTENRVTLDSIKKRVESTEYIHPNNAPHFTLAFVKLNNGFMVTGESACADPKNFDEQLGRSIAYENALRKVWALEGYLLCEKLTAESETETGSGDSAESVA